MDLQYPVGRFEWSGTNSPDDRRRLLNQIEQTPARLRAAVEGLSAEQLDTPYRPDGWTVRQVVHHVPDSHVNAYVRIKLALTEDVPTIKPYDESKWAELPDGKSKLIEQSLALLDALHARWVFLLRRLKPSDFARTYNHPEWDTPMSLDHALAMCA